MNIKSFFLGLLPNFERSRIIEDIESLRIQVRDNLLPAFKNSETLMKANAYKAQLSNDFNGAFGVAVPKYRGHTFFQAMLGFLATSLDKLDFLDRIVPEMFAQDVTKESLTYRKTFVLQYLSALRFVDKYASMMLLRMVAAETYASQGRTDLIDSQLNQAELKWLAQNREAFFQAVKTLDISVKDLGHALETAADVRVMPDRIAALVQTLGVDKVDPLRMGFIVSDMNPIYFMRKVYAEFQVKRYKAKLEEKTLLELRLLQLKQAQSGKQDAKLDKAIEYSEGRLGRLNYELNEMQSEYTA